MNVENDRNEEHLCNHNEYYGSDHNNKKAFLKIFCKSMIIIKIILSNILTSLSQHKETIIPNQKHILKAIIFILRVILPILRKIKHSLKTTISSISKTTSCCNILKHSIRIYMFHFFHLSCLQQKLQLKHLFLQIRNPIPIFPINTGLNRSKFKLLKLTYTII